jgi:hypothetical protein
MRKSEIVQTREGSDDDLRLVYRIAPDDPLKEMLAV